MMQRPFGLSGASGLIVTTSLATHPPAGQLGDSTTQLGSRFGLMLLLGGSPLTSTAWVSRFLRVFFHSPFKTRENTNDFVGFTRGIGVASNGETS